MERLHRPNVLCVARIAAGIVLLIATLIAVPAAHGQCNCTCDPIVPANLQIDNVMMNEDGGSATHLVSASGPRGLAREVRHGNLFSGGITVTHVCIALQSPTGQPGEIAHVQFYQPDPDPINMDLPGAMMYDQQFQINTGINGHQIVELQTPQTMSAAYWIVVAYPTAQPSTGHQGTRPRTSGASAVYVGGPSLPPPHNYTVGWRYYDDLGGPGGTNGYFGNAPIIRPLTLSASGSACPHGQQCCDTVCTIDPSCCTTWTSACDDLALQHCFTGSCATCPPGALDEAEPCNSDLNGGCDSNLSVMPLPCDTTMCGSLGVDANGIVDTDWYQLDVIDQNGDGMSFLTIDTVSDVPVEVVVQNTACPGDFNYVTYTGGQTQACVPSIIGGAVPSPGTYWISVTPLSNPATCPSTSDYTLRVDVDDCASGPTPINDDCADAATMPIGPNETITFENFNATTDGPLEPCGFSGTDDADVWFEFTSPCTGIVTYELLSSDHPEYLLAAYGGGCPSFGGVMLNCSGAFIGIPLFLDVPVIAGEVHTLRMGAPNGATGTATLTAHFQSCLGDLNSDCAVNTSDLLILLGAWGSCPDPTICPADLDGNGAVNVSDMLQMLGAWGQCP